MHTNLGYTMNYDIDEIRSANCDAGYHFFDLSAMRFFSSRICKKVYQGVGGVFFVTSEQYDIGHPRKYTVRRFDPQTGDIHTATKFYSIDTLKEAYRQAQALADGVQQSAA